MHPSQTALTYSTDFQKPYEQRAQQTAEVVSHPRSSRRPDRLQILSDVAEVHTNLRSSQTQDPHHALAIIQSVVHRSLPVDKSLETDESIRSLKRVKAALDQRNGPETTAISGSSDGESSSSRSAPITCQKCNKTFKRQCELKKHEKRHTKPYICTAASCSHRFGSKHDWLRHERTCDHQKKEYPGDNQVVRVCLEADPSTPATKCGFVHASEEYFRDHLKISHNILEEEALTQSLVRCQPPNCKPGYGWCGFCLENVQWSGTLKSGDSRNHDEGYGNRADRALHIDWHVTRERRDMEQYVSMGQHLKKEVPIPDKLQTWFRTENSRDSDPRIHNPDYVPVNHKKRKRESIGSDDEYKKKLDEAMWSCVRKLSTATYRY
jgi:hypothetical protein